MATDTLADHCAAIREALAKIVHIRREHLDQPGSRLTVKLVGRNEQWGSLEGEETEVIVALVNHVGPLLEAVEEMQQQLAATTQELRRQTQYSWHCQENRHVRCGGLQALLAQRTEALTRALEWLEGRNNREAVDVCEEARRALADNA